MSNEIQLVPLSRSIELPFNKLILSQANVRQTKAGVSIEELAEDIGRRGLLQSLNVRPILNNDGAETGKYEVPAGGRRFRALELLAQQKRLPKNAPIPCVLKDKTATTSMEDDSLAENVHREALHPLDQYRAFLVLYRQNLSEEEIAARYFVAVGVVKQRLRLAAVAPSLLELYANETLTLDQLMAFSITNDHVRQEQVWATLSTVAEWERQPFRIKRMLTESTVAADDRRAIFVGVEAYEAAGGEVLRDLFSSNNGGWLQNPGLLDRLVGEKLLAIANEVKGEGWKWIEVLTDLPFDHLNGLRKIEPLVPTLSDEDQAALDALTSERAALEETYAEFDEYPDEVDARLGELETLIDGIESQDLSTFEENDKAMAGVVITIDRSGAAQFLRGYVRPEDEPAEDITARVDDGGSGEGPASIRETAVITIGATAPVAAPTTDDDDGDVLRPLPERLIGELTAFRTVALRDAVAGNPRVAMTVFLHKVVGDTFRHLVGSCLQVSIIGPQLVNVAPSGLNDSLPHRSMQDRHERWGDVIPADDQALWDWLDQADDYTRDELFAFCVSFGVNALIERPSLSGGYPSQRQIDERGKQATRLAQATGLDLVTVGWRATADSYLNRIPKSRILEAVREGCGERAAQLIDHLKKGEMVVEAERLLADTGWLPEVLRLPDDGGISDEASSASLPAFLAEPETAIAAE